jgi:DNA (cytosine-5)-methyltransferase 1
MENVRGLAVKDGGKHLRRVEVRLRESGYAVTTLDVRAADFGVPQLRHRIFVVATRLDLQIDYQVVASHDESTVLTVWDAISDLPPLKAGTRSTEYLHTETEYQREMRGDVGYLTWHEAPAHSDRILEILRALPREGASRSELTPRITLTSGFHNTYCRLWADKPAPAVTSSAGRVSSGRNAHPYDDRALTPREAARLQSFPDSYVWEGDRWPVYQQIGNAVPPRLAEAIARPLINQLMEAL